MRKHGVLLTLAALEAFALALSALFWFVMRPDLFRTYGLDRVPQGHAIAEGLGPAARVALSSWFVPLAALGGAFLVLLALVFQMRTRTRTYLAGTGLVWTVFGLTFAIWSSYAPAFEQLAP